MASKMCQQLHYLMTGLYYPAVLGTGLVLVLFRCANHSGPEYIITDFALGFGALFIVFFSLSFLAITRIDSAEYTPNLFCLDLIEVTCIFFSFYFLGLLDSSVIQPPRLAAVYWLIVFLGVVQGIGSWVREREHSKLRWTLRGLTVAVAFLAALLTDTLQIADSLVLGVFFLLVTAYFWTFAT